MSPEVVKYCKRAIIDYLAGNMEEFKKLTNLAMTMHKQVYTCKSCGGELIEGKYGQGKGKKKAMICFECGSIYINGEKVRKARGELYV